jgi:alcohol dehydrogenase, propanol-preferring
VLVTAPSPKAFEQALGMVRRGGTVVLNGLPPGSFPLPIVDMVLWGITLRGSIVETRLDLQEALDFTGEGAVKATVRTARLEDINDVLTPAWDDNRKYAWVCGLEEAHDSWRYIS